MELKKLLVTSLALLVKTRMFLGVDWGLQRTLDYIHYVAASKGLTGYQ